MFPDLEFHHVQGFIAVARAESFTKAADELGLSQSALSRSVQKLEQRNGQTLFETRQLATVQELVSLDHGIPIIPEMARTIDSGEERIYRLFKNLIPVLLASVLVIDK